jgi:hypothetical protein
VIVGILFQVSGAAAVGYCFVIGAGILLLDGGAIWWVQELRRRKPSSLGM